MENISLRARMWPPPLAASRPDIVLERRGDYAIAKRRRYIGIGIQVPFGVEPRRHHPIVSTREPANCVGDSPSPFNLGD